MIESLRLIECSRSRLRSALLGILVGGFGLPLFVTSTLASTVALSITNDDTRSLRCMIVFAHWVTTDFGPIAAGETATVAMARGPQAGTLHIARFDGRPMMIENIVCGTEQDWSDSFDQLPLMQIRSGDTSTYHLACRAAPRIVCTPSPEFVDDRERRPAQD